MALNKVYNAYFWGRYKYMLLKLLKKQILRKKIDTKLQKVSRQFKDKSMPIKSVGCLIDYNLISDSSYFNQLSKELNVNQNDIQLLTFEEEKEVSSNFFGLKVSKKSISWKSDIISDDAHEFMSQEYDLLINFFKNSNSVLGLISANTNALFRVGFENIDNRFNDLIFSSKMSNDTVFGKELIRYLKIMNKI